MAEALDRSGHFFALFEDCRGYTNFFLLHDLVSDVPSSVKVFMPFADFGTAPRPTTVEAYQDYRESAIRFIIASSREPVRRSCIQRSLHADGSIPWARQYCS
jgi:hypothetical protein